MATPNKENKFISYFSSSLNGDDGAFCNGFVYSTDSFFENVHFKREWMSLKQIAEKAMLVNISDAIASREAWEESIRAMKAATRAALPRSGRNAGTGSQRISTLPISKTIAFTCPSVSG